MAKQRDYYVEIDRMLKSYEGLNSWHECNINLIADRIAWCWKWGKITEEQMTELTDRIIVILDGGVAV